MLVNKNILYFTVMLALLIFVGFYQSWNVSLSILNMCLISAVMALGVNIQWGYAGLFNVGIMGFAALGGLAELVDHIAVAEHKVGRDALLARVHASGPAGPLGRHLDVGRLVDEDRVLWMGVEE